MTIPVETAINSLSYSHLKFWIHLSNALNWFRISLNSAHFEGYVRKRTQFSLVFTCHSLFFAKEPCKRDDILQKRPRILRSLRIIAEILCMQLSFSLAFTKIHLRIHMYTYTHRQTQSQRDSLAFTKIHVHSLSRPQIQSCTLFLVSHCGMGWLRLVGFFKW